LLAILEDDQYLFSTKAAPVAKVEKKDEKKVKA